MPTSLRVLYIVHDAQIYGSQQSLTLILDQACKAFDDGGPPAVEPFVSVARLGPLTDRLAKKAHLKLLSHKRLQWFKHDIRKPRQRFMDCTTLLLNLPLRVWQVYRHIKKYRIDLVHTNSTVSLEGALAAKLAGVPHVWHIRELFMEDSPKLVPLFGKAFTRGVINALSDRVICISSAVQKQFKPYLKKKPQKFPIIYNALSDEQIPDESILKRETSTPLLIGFAGRLSHGKGLHDLLDAFVLLQKMLPEECLPRLKVVGNFVDAHYKHRIETLLYERELEKYVELYGYQQNLCAFYRQLDLLVVPSRNEPFGRVIIEAMAYAVPSIAADSGGIPEIIAHDATGWLYSTGNTEALAQKIHHVTTHPEILREVGQSARRMVLERFTIEQQWRQLLAAYDQLH